MKKVIFSLFSMLCFVITLTAKPVSESTAQKVAKNFLSYNAAGQMNAQPEVIIAYIEKSKATITSGSNSPVYYYVFNNSTGPGFVMVSGDDASLPILAYSTESNFQANDIPWSVKKWFEGYKDQVRYIIEHQVKPTAEIMARWKDLIDGKSNLKKTYSSVSPLISTKWNQWPYYNDLCPYDSKKKKLSVTGCVATAMAQVLKYWEYPKQGEGFHSYNHSYFGTISANFASTTYNWSKMPAKISSKNTDIATLMFHCGVSVDMNYSPESSGAYVISSDSKACTENALKDYFGYSSKLKGVKRDNYSETSWINLLKNELDNERPIIYAGFGGGGGHCFVADGYDNNDYFHFNWGWGGAYDGYFEVSALNPDGLGTGGGTGAYNYNQQAVIGVEPATKNGGSISETTIGLYSKITIDKSPLYYGQAFTINADVINTGSKNFSGKYCAALFDADYNFVDFIGDSISETSLPQGYHYKNGLDFISQGMLSAIPGTYYVGIYYKNGNGGWIPVDDNSGYYNYSQLKITNPNSIELYSDFNMLSGNTLINGKKVEINVDIANYGSNSFNGIVDLSLFNLDGTLAYTIEQKSGITMATQTHFKDGLTFSNNNLNLKPGTYLLALMHKPNSGNWQITGSSLYTNPIKVIVEKAPIIADKYEVNNTPKTAYKFTASFSNDKAQIRTVDANFHNESDYDYYKISLPAGYKYSIKPSINDLNYPNGGSYTVDALFSYSLDGTTWSDAYDNKLDKDIVLEDGGDIYFIVSPYFQGQTGTYKFLADIERTKDNPIIADQYEDNNTLKKAYQFIPVFMGDKSLIETVGANFHIENDYDYYQIHLSKGYKYILNAEINDLVYPKGGTYTTDALVTYSTNGTDWSDAYDDVINKEIAIEDGGDVYFMVSPRYKEKLGTYKLKVEINRQEMEPSSIKELSGFNFEMYPNPAKENVVIQWAENFVTNSTISILDLSGKVLKTAKVNAGEKSFIMPLKEFNSGIYILQIQSDKGIINKPLMISK